MSILDKAREAADKAKGAAKKYTDDLKQQEAKNNEMIAASMEERVRMRPEGVKFCIVNTTGKILDVYENKVVFTSTKSTSTIVTGLLLGSSMTQGEKTIYFRDAIGVQYRPSSIADGYIQVETAAGGQSANSAYGGENSIQFSGKKTNEEAEIVVDYIRKQIETVKNAPASGGGQQVSPMEEIKKLKELLDLSIVTQEEFDEKKKQLLGL